MKEMPNAIIKKVTLDSVSHGSPVILDVWFKIFFSFAIQALEESAERTAKPMHSCWNVGTEG